MLPRQKIYEEPVQIAIESINGDLLIPDEAKSLVIFAHGSGSSRFSKRNKFVANELNNANIATLLVDLLTEEEDLEDQISRIHRFNIGLLARRLIKTSEWIQEYPKTKNLKLGYFGASTGAAAALIAATNNNKVAAIVSRGGRPDLAYESLEKITAPVLFIVGGNDYDVIELNNSAYKHMHCIKEMKIVQKATHLFEEPGKLEEMTLLAREWFEKYL